MHGLSLSQYFKEGDDNASLSRAEGARQIDISRCRVHSRPEQRYCSDGATNIGGLMMPSLLTAREAHRAWCRHAHALPFDVIGKNTIMMVPTTSATIINNGANID